jgi:fused signal recognition particle receptor
MFDFLKKKIGGFIDSLTKKEEEKEPKEAIPEKEKIEELPEEEIRTKPETGQRIAPEIKKEIAQKEEKTPTKPAPKIEVKKEGPKIQKEKRSEPKKIEPPKPEKTKIPETKPVPREIGEKIESTKPIPQIKRVEPKKEEKPEPVIQKPEQKPKQEVKPAVVQAPKRVIEQPIQLIPKPAIQQIKKPEAHPVPKQPEIEKEVEIPEQTEPPEKEIKRPEPPKQEKPEPVKASEQKPRIKLSPISVIKSFITSEVEIKEADVKEMLENLELELLESDVDMSVAQAITEDISSRLIGAKIKKGELHPFITRSIRQTLIEVLTNDKSFDLVERVESAEKPLKIMFIGINGAGKTTTIAKVARLLMDGKKKVVFAAADTFRAAAIEQIQIHADRLGVKMIKRDYGSDPTSVAYDAVGYAKAHAIDAVLIDTAGRQDTNISLLNEIKKMSRVINPDLKIYIGESISGNAIVEQISSFNREVGIDAVILTKMDCDPKGGTMLSISKATGIPIIYVGTGQAYADLERFIPEKIAERIVG